MRKRVSSVFVQSFALEKNHIRIKNDFDLNLIASVLASYNYEAGARMFSKSSDKSMIFFKRFQ